MNPIRSRHIPILLLALIFAPFGSACQSGGEIDTDPVTPVEPTPEEEMPDSWHIVHRDQPYPKAGNGIYVNPAPLIVPAAMAPGKWVEFELSQDAAFPAASTQRSEPKTWCVFSPHRALQVGRWYWRFRSSDDLNKPGAWSDTYSFEITPDIPEYVTADFETLLAHAPHTFPRLHCYLDPQIEQARQTVTTHREYKKLTSRANAAINADYSTKDPNTDAAQLKVYLQSLYNAYHLTRQVKYVNRMRELLGRLLDCPVSDKLLLNTDNFTTTDICLCYLLIYDALHDSLTPAERNGIESILMRVLRKLTASSQKNKENHIFDNHFWQHNLRIYFQSAFMLYDHPTYGEEVRPMLEYYYELWCTRAPATGFNRDGAWHNGSSYMTANLATLYYMPMLCSYLTDSNLLKHPWYQNCGRALCYTWPPHSESGSFGDGCESRGEPVRIVAAFADFLARETGDCFAGWYAAECDDVLQEDLEFRLYRMCATRDYARDLPARLAKMIWYQDIGEVAMHTHPGATDQDVLLSFRSSIFGSGSHTTACQNGFNLLYHGRYVYHSSGYYLDYNSPHAILSYRHTRAHNTLLVNGIGQTFSPAGYGNVVRAMEGAHITCCTGDASNAYHCISDDPSWINKFNAAGITQTPEYGFGATPLTRYRRQVLMLHPEGTVVIYDELEASEAVDYDWLLHSDRELLIDPNRQIVSHTDPSGGFVASTRLFCNDPMQLSVTDQFFVPVPDPTAYPNQWHLTARIADCSRTRIMAILQVADSEEEIRPIERNGNHLRIGDWSIDAQLDAAQPASLTITHAVDPVVYHSGDAHTPSQLYDIPFGSERYEVMEMSDRTPLSTRNE